MRDADLKLTLVEMAPIQDYRRPDDLNKRVIARSAKTMAELAVGRKPALRLVVSKAREEAAHA